MSLEEEVGYDLSVEVSVDAGQLVPSRKRRTCNICGESIGEKIKRHAFAKHLPWYIEPLEACWECEVHVKDLNRHVASESTACGVQSHFDEWRFPIWCQLIFGLLMFFRSHLNLDSISDLLTYVIKHGLYPPPIVEKTGNFNPWQQQLLRKLSLALGMSFHEGFDISPPSNVVCILHWKILSKLILVLNAPDRDSLKSRTFPLPIPNHLQLGNAEGAFIDSHCHIDKIFQNSGFGKFTDYLQHYSQRRPALQFCICNFVYPSLWATISQLRGCNYMVRCTIGIHPHFVEISSECNQIGRIAELLASGNFVGVGEVGVDYISRCACGFCYDKNVCLKVKAQRNFLTEVVPLAVQYHLPLVIHCRGESDKDGQAAEDVLNIIKRTGHTRLRIHRHCFIGNLAEMHQWIETFPNIMFGFTKRSLRHSPTRAALSFLSMDRVLLETDSPYLDSPDPWSVKDICQKVSEIKSLPVDTVRDICNYNARQFYRLCP